MEVVRSAKAQLLLTIDHAWNNQKRDKVALLVSSELVYSRGYQTVTVTIVWRNGNIVRVIRR